MADALKNFAYSTVATAPSPATTGTSLVVATGDGTKFAVGNAVCWPPNVQPSVANAEIVRVTAISTDTLTITRTQEGSTNQSIAVGWQIDQGVTAGLLAQYLALSGGTMSGALAMGANKITGLANGTAATDAAAFGQLPGALAYDAANLSVAVTLSSTANAYTTVQTSGSLAVGIWLVTVSYAIQNGSAATNYPYVNIAAGTAAFSLLGGAQSGEIVIAGANGYGYISFTALVHVTTAGTVIIEAAFAAAGGGIVAQSNNSAHQSGYVAVKIA